MLRAKFVFSSEIKVTDIMSSQIEVNKFSIADYCVFAGVLVVSMSIGIYHGCTGGRQRTTNEFFMANRSMNWLPVALSLLASFMSAITLLGTPAEMYQYGTHYWMIAPSYIFTIFISTHCFLPVFYRFKITSAYEYLELRYKSKLVRTLGSVTFSIQMILYMAIVLYAPALALNAVTGLNIWGSVLSIGLVCTAYTTIGGMKAVMWTDVFQITMMFAGMIAVVIKGSLLVDGFSNAWQIAYDGERVEFFDFSVDPLQRHTFWSLVIGGVFTWTAIYGVNQAQVQRCLTCPNKRSAQMAMWINLPGLALLLTVCSMAGIVIYAVYHDCDPLTNEFIHAPDQILPFFVMQHLGLPGLPGLFVAGLFSGALSTISSGLNSLAAVACEDIVKPYLCKNFSDVTYAWISKVIAIVYGGVAIGLTVVAANLGGVLQAALSIFGMIGGPLLGLFSLSMFFPWANKWGAIFGHLGGLAFSFWIGMGAYIHKPYTPKAPLSVEGCPFNVTTSIGPPTVHPEVFPLYRLSYMWFSAAGCMAVIILGLIISFLTGYTRPSTLDPRFICAWFDVWVPCMPKKLSRFLWCGVNHDLEPEEEEDIVKQNLKNGKVLDLAATKPGEVNPGFVYADGSTYKPGINPELEIRMRQKEAEANKPHPNITVVNNDNVTGIRGTYRQYGEDKHPRPEDHQTAL